MSFRICRITASEGRTCRPIEAWRKFLRHAHAPRFAVIRCCLCVAGLGSLAAPAAGAALPNIVVIYADDLGYGDVACYNRERGRIPTPHLDRLAAEGMRFTDAHSSSGVCSPSRYTLLTGRYHWRTRLQRGIVGLWGPPLIAETRMTVATLLAQRGYRTACIGKWHLGWDWPIDPSQRPLFRSPPGQHDLGPVTEAHRSAWRAVFSRPIPGGPTSRGFATYFGTDVPNWPPFCFIENDATVGIPSEYLPLRLFRDHLASRQGPALPDWRLEAILPTLGQHASDWIVRAAERGEPFFLYLPLTAPHTPLAVAPRWRGRSGLTTYADFVMQTDAVVGQVLDAIARSGQAARTLVLFTSDNGCAPYIGVRELERLGHFPSGPLRGYKSDAWEGGHRVPFIIRWPGVVPAGTVSPHLVHQADWLATCAAIVHTPLPPTAGEDSVSLLPLMRGADRPVREIAVSQSAGGLLAIRQGRWKLIFGAGSGGWSKGRDPLPAQLYDLSEDIGETHNLYADRPDVVARLTLRMEKLVRAGRSTPGPSQRNDVPVDWRRFLEKSAEPGG